MEAQIWITQAKVETYAFTQGNKFQPRNYSLNIDSYAG